MTRIDFYVLSEQGDDARWQFAARLAEKAFRQNLSVLILTGDAATAHQLDGLLWQFAPESFLPHALAQEQADARIILAAASHEPVPVRDLLVNLSDALPSHWQQFARMSEVVTQSPQVLRSTRARYAQFKELGHPVMTHKLS